MAFFRFVNSNNITQVINTDHVVKVVITGNGPFDAGICFNCAENDFYYVCYT